MKITGIETSVFPVVTKYWVMFNIIIIMILFLFYFINIV